MELTSNYRNVFGLGWLTGPIFDKELRVCSRRKRYYWLRGLYLATMAAVILTAWMSSRATFGMRGNAFSASRMSEIGRIVITSIIWFQFVIAQVSAILFFSNSICEEMNQGTLNVLMSTPITSLQIVIGKLLSRLVQLVMILCLSLSTISIVYVFGGVHWEYVIATFFITLTAVVFMGTLTLFFSSTIKRPYSVIIVMLCFMCMYYMIGSAIFRGAAANIGKWILLFNPLNAMMEVTTKPAGGGFAWWLHCLVMIAVSAVLVLCAIIRLRKTMLSFAFERNVKRKGLAGFAGRIKRFVAGGSAGYPIRLKGLPRIYRVSPLKLAIVIAAFAVWGFLICYYAPIGQGMGMVSSWQIMFNTVNTMVWIIVFIRTIMCAATAITNEKENRTLTALLTTPLTDKQIINGKLKNVFRRNVAGWLFVFVNSLLFYAVMLSSQLQNGLGVGQLVLSLSSQGVSIMASFFFIMCFGLYISVRVRSNTVALVAGLLGYLLWYFVSYLIMIIPGMIGAFFSMRMYQFITFFRPIISVVVALLFLWRAKKSLRRYACVK